jgi:hypothetical protein
VRAAQQIYCTPFDAAFFNRQTQHERTGPDAA